MRQRVLFDTEVNIKLVNDLYNNKKLNGTQIADYFGVKLSVIYKFMKRNNIKKRSPSEVKIKISEQECIDDIIRLYIEEKLCINEISEIYPCVHRQTISNILKRNNIIIDYNRKSKKQLALIKSTTKDICKDELIDLYCNKNMTTPEIAKIYDTTPTTVIKNLKRLNIEIITLSERLKDEDYRNLHISRMRENITEETDQKRIKTCIDKYGVDNPFKLSSIQEKAKRTMFQNQTAPCSLQQKYLCELLGGELNYPISRCNVDIAFVKEKIIIEYNGGGHDLTITLNNCTEEEFLNKEMRRRHFLRDLGWKQITIISKDDKLPSDKSIFNIINVAKDYLNRGHFWIEFDLDNSLIRTSQYEQQYDFGKLRKVNKKDVQQSA